SPGTLWQWADRPLLVREVCVGSRADSSRYEWDPRLVPPLGPIALGEVQREQKKDPWESTGLRQPKNIAECLGGSLSEGSLEGARSAGEEDLQGARWPPYPWCLPPRDPMGKHNAREKVGLTPLSHHLPRL